MTDILLHAAMIQLHVYRDRLREERASRHPRPAIRRDPLWRRLASGLVRHRSRPAGDDPA